MAVGTLIALIADEGTDWKSVKIPEDVVQEGSQKPQISESPVEAPRVERYLRFCWYVMLMHESALV